MPRLRPGLLSRRSLALPPGQRGIQPSCLFRRFQAASGWETWYFIPRMMSSMPPWSSFRKEALRFLGPRCTTVLGESPRGGWLPGRSGTRQGWRKPGSPWSSEFGHCRHPASLGHKGPPAFLWMPVSAWKDFSAVQIKAFRQQVPCATVRNGS